MTSGRPRSFTRGLSWILAGGLLARIAYVLAQPRFDPTFAHPILDGAYYVEIARAWSSGSPAGVFYMPPLYPAVLALFLAAFGTAWGALYVVQHALMVLAAGALALVARRLSGPVAGWAAAALVLLYPPALYFASRPLGEPGAIALLAVGLALALAPGAYAGAGAGAAAGLSALARPNLLPLAALWGVNDATRGSLRRGLLLLGAAVAVVLPVALHNLNASGKLVPVSANGGVVFWLGNAPDAVGLYTPAEGFSGALATQQAEAIAEAGRRSGRPLGPVESDRFWLREGIRARLESIPRTIALLGRKIALTLDNAEHGLDYAPSLDRNPVRWVAPLPFALLLGLATAGVVARGFGGTGGVVVWSAIALNALAPVAFYVSSRHRLPFAVLLAIPAGVAVAAFGDLPATRRGRAALAAGGVAAVLSFGLPTAPLVRSGQAGSLAVLADVALRNGDLVSAADTARRATGLDPSCTLAWYNLGVIESAAGRPERAEQAYRRALETDPVHAGAAGNLGALLLASGRSAEAVGLLQGVLSRTRGSDALWSNFLVGLVQTGRGDDARRALARAQALGIEIDPGLARAVLEMEHHSP